MERETSNDPMRLRSLIIGAVLCILLLAGMTVLDRALKTPAAPAGIISFELAGTLTGAERILASWDASARIQAGISLGVDFFFLAAYAFTLVGICRRVAIHLPPHFRRLRRWGFFLAGAAWFAAFLDVVENMMLIQLLLGNAGGWQPVLAALCAWPKFGITACILMYIVLGSGYIFMRRSGAWRPS